MAPRTSGGGAATAGGMDFQHRVAAWVATHILAEQDAAPRWGLPAATTLEFLRCETGLPVDDLLVGTRDNGFSFIQAKLTIQLSNKPDSVFASVVDQFVGQFIACQTATTSPRLWDRPLGRVKDRLLLITGPNSSAPVRIHLAAALKRLSSLAPGQPVEDAAVNSAETKALNIIREHVRRTWQTITGCLPTDAEIRNLLAIVYIETLSIEAGESDENGAKALLRQTILRNPTQADAAWAKLIEACSGFAQHRSGANRIEFQEILLGAGFDLHAARSYRDSIEKLKGYSTRTTALLADLASIRIGTDEIKITRLSTEQLRHLAEEGSSLVVGDPGAGKSAALYDLAQRLRSEGRDLIFLAVDRIEAQTLPALQTELGIRQDITEILLNWPGTAPAFLIIDALDAARAEPAARTLRDLIRLVVKAKGRWRILASIRKFDLRYSQELQELFRGTTAGKMAPELRLAEFSHLRHLNIPLLTDEELDQIPPQSAELQALIVNAPDQLRDLLRVPFNLRLLGELLGTGVTSAELVPIKTQLELLDRYWSHRIIRSDAQGDARESLLRRSCEAMVAARMLRVNRAALADPASSATLNELLSSQVLTEWQPSPATLPDRYVLTFSHHALFDYAVARLLLRGTQEALVRRLVDDRELALVIRPSLLLHFQHLWMRNPDHLIFWGTVLQIMAADVVPEIGRLIGPAVAASLARELSELEPLCLALESADEQIKKAAEQTLRHLTGSVIATSSTGSGSSSPWIALLERVSR